MRHLLFHLHLRLFLLCLSPFLYFLGWQFSSGVFDQFDLAWPHIYLSSEDFNFVVSPGNFVAECLNGSVELGLPSFDSFQERPEYFCVYCRSV